MATTITYNGSTIATISNDGGTKILDCSGELMGSSVVITADKAYVPELIVYVDTGSSITVTDGTTTYTGTSVSGSCTFSLNALGTWTATATLGSESTSGNVLVSAATTYELTLNYIHIYGAEWDGTSTTSWSRTDDASSFTDPVPALGGTGGSSPFDTISPWKDMTVTTDSEAGELVSIPKFWYKWTRSGATMKLQISSEEADGFSVSPAHADRGDGKGERDVVYVGKYHCATSTYKSTTGVAQACSATRSAFRSSISNLGSTIWQWDYAMVWTIRMLYLVEFADWNSQVKIGYGCSASSSKANNGQTDSISYHTGTTAATRTTYGFTKYRNIEGLWDNVFDWVDGIYYTSSGQYIISNPSNFSDSANGTLITSSMPNASGYISAWSEPSTSGYDWAVTSSAFSGSTTTYVADNGYVHSSYPCVCVGGYYYQYQDSGLFCANCNSSSYARAFVGSRLQKLP